MIEYFINTFLQPLINMFLTTIGYLINILLACTIGYGIYNQLPKATPIAQHVIHTYTFVVGAPEGIDGLTIPNGKITVKFGPDRFGQNMKDEIIARMKRMNIPVPEEIVAQKHLVPGTVIIEVQCQE